MVHSDYMTMVMMMCLIDAYPNLITKFLISYLSLFNCHFSKWTWVSQY